jgi:two-component system NtrC family response regulator
MALIREALDSCNGSMAEAARRLQVERSLLYKKMEKFGMK